MTGTRRAKKPTGTGATKTGGTVDTRDGPLPADSTDRCEHTDLFKVQCAHCRHPEMPAKPMFVAPPDEWGGGTEEDENRVVATFQAQYGGRCAGCDTHYARGALISKTAGGDYLCTDCGWDA